MKDKNNDNIIKELFNPTIANLLIHMKSNSKLRYGDLKKEFRISDATLSWKMKILKKYNLIEADTSKNTTGKIYIVYSLTDIGINMESKIKKYLDLIKELN